MITSQRTHLLVVLLALVLASCGSGGASGDRSEAPVASPAGLASRTSDPSPAGVPSQPTATAAPSAVPSDTPSDTPSAAVEPTSAPLALDLPSRIVIPELRIDLPIVSGDLAASGNPPDYPLCDVAQYLTTYRYPGRLATTTWIYAHARTGMFLPLLRGSERNEGRALIGLTVDLYSDASVRYRYRITEVLRHATDRGSARDVPADARRLVLQTSEGPKGTVPKLQVVAEWIGSVPADVDAARPTPYPRVCFDP